MTERTAVYYGEVELIPNVVCDGYVLEDGTAMLSIVGTANLLSMSHQSLQNNAVNGLPKQLKSFCDIDFNNAVKPILVSAKNSKYNGRVIDALDCATIEALIKAYAFAFANNLLRENQEHTGKRCIFLMGALIRTALEVAIKQACGIPTDIQQTAQQHYIDVVKIVKDHGFKCSIPNDIAIKKDIAQFLDIPESTLGDFRE